MKICAREEEAFLVWGKGLKGSEGADAFKITQEVQPVACTFAPRIQCQSAGKTVISELEPVIPNINEYSNVVE